MRNRHLPGGPASTGTSTFNAGENLIDLICAAEDVSPSPQENGRFRRVVNAGPDIGWDRATQAPTSIYAAITEVDGTLVTAFAEAGMGGLGAAISVAGLGNFGASAC